LGTGNATREFLYVEDAAEAIVLAAQSMPSLSRSIWGRAKKSSPRAFWQLIRSLTGFEGAVRWDATKPDGQPRRCLDTSRALAEFGWWRKHSLRDGIRKNDYMVLQRIQQQAAFRAQSDPSLD